MSLPAVANEAATGTTTTAIATTNSTTNATTDTITNPPTVVSPENYIDKNDPPDNDADRTTSTAPLLPAYSFTMGPPPPRTTWRRMTGGLAEQRNTDRRAYIIKHPGVHNVYTRKWWFLIVQWFFTFWVLGATARSLTIAENLASVVPMLTYTVACAAVHVVPMYYFVNHVNPALPRNPRPAWWYLISYAISSFAWIGAMVCVVLVLIKSMPFDGEKDREHGLQRCSRGRKCYASTHNAQINTNAKMNIATVGFILLSIIGHWYQISKLWLCNFMAEETRAAYDFAPGSFFKGRS
ncbi:hypothetical protein V499_03113 [Pseudogymnoascus sp. VKM F-103]|nr:hypothetical protein V499_03113 [Pseudogymnoascus sp. VKM F-103]